MACWWSDGTAPRLGSLWPQAGDSHVALVCIWDAACFKCRHPGSHHSEAAASRHSEAASRHSAVKLQQAGTARLQEAGAWLPGQWLLGTLILSEEEQGRAERPVASRPVFCRDSKMGDPESCSHESWHWALGSSWWLPGHLRSRSWQVRELTQHAPCCW